MKKIITPVQTVVLMLAAMLAAYGAGAATTYTATVSGALTSGSTWSGGVAPPATLTAVDHIVIPSGITVDMDHDLALANANSSLEIYGTLTGSSRLDVRSGFVLGDGAIDVQSVIYGAQASQNYTGKIRSNSVYAYRNIHLYDSTFVRDSLVLMAGSTDIMASGRVILADRSTLVLGNGSYALYGGTVYTAGDLTITYAGSGRYSTGIELNLPGVKNINVYMRTDSDEVVLTRDITLDGLLYILHGRMDVTGKNVSVQKVNTGRSITAFKANGASFTIANADTSDPSSVSFMPGYDSLSSLTLHLGVNGLILNSDLKVMDNFDFLTGRLLIAGNAIEVRGYREGQGKFLTTSSTNVSIYGSGDLGTLRWESDSAAVGALYLSLTGGNGKITLGSGLQVGGLEIEHGVLDLGGHDLALVSYINQHDNTYIRGYNTSTIKVRGNGYEIGRMIFAPGYDTIANLTFNSTEDGSRLKIGNNLHIMHGLNLIKGYLDLDSTFSVSVHGTDSVTGGSQESYINTMGTGMVWINMSNQGSANARTIPVGTHDKYAPIRITNLGQASGHFGAQAHAGIWADGTSGADLSATASSVNISWNVESDVTTGNNVTMEAYWNQGMEMNQFNNNNTYISHYTGGAWDTYAGVASVTQANAMSSVVRTGITSFSPFAVFSSPDAIPTAVKDIDASGISVYPNPAIDRITVSLADESATSDVRVYDVAGKKVAAYPVTHRTNSIDISSLEAGVYYLSVNNGNTHKLIKQ